MGKAIGGVLQFAMLVAPFGIGWLLAVWTWNGWHHISLWLRVPLCVFTYGIGTAIARTGILVLTAGVVALLTRKEN